MTNPSPNPEPTAAKPWRRAANRIFQPRTLLVVGGGVVILGGATYLTLQWWVRSQLSDLLNERLSEILNRPVNVGEVERFTLGGLQLDGIRIPKTEIHDNSVTVKALRVNYDLLALFSGELPLKFTLIEPQVYAAQADDGTWLDLDLNLPESEDGGGELPIDLPINLRLEDGDIQLLTRSASEPFQLSLNGKAQLRQKLSVARYDLNLDAPTGGLTLAGQTQLETLESRVDTQIQNLGIEQFVQFLPQDLRESATVKSGNIDANLNIELPPLQEPEPNPDETQSNRAQRVALDIDPNDIPRVRGTLDLNNIVVEVDPLAQPLEARGLIRFQGDRVILENVSVSTGALQVKADGRADIQGGYDLDIEIPPVPLEAVPQLVKEPLPEIPLAGRLQLNANILGEFDKPQLTLAVRNDSPLSLADTRLDELRVNLTANPSQVVLNGFRITPAAGGRIVARGEADITSVTEYLLNDTSGIEPNPSFTFDLRANLPTDALLSPYLDLPPDVFLGPLKARVDARGTAKTPVVQLAWDTPESIVSQLGLVTSNGRVRFIDNQINLETAEIRAGGGVITATGEANLDSQNWTAEVDSTPIDLSPYLDLPARLTQLNALASGRLDDTSPDTLNLNANVGLTVADGAANVQANAEGGRIDVLARASGLSARGLNLDVPVPATLLDGRATVNTTLDAVLAVAETQDYSGIRVNAEADLAVAEGIVNAFADIDRGNVLAGADVSSILLSPYLPDVPVPLSVRSANARVNTTLDALLTAAETQQPQGIDAFAQADLGVADGTVNAFANVENGNVLAGADASAIALSPYLPEVPVPLAVRDAQARVNTTVNALLETAQTQQPRGIDLFANANLAVADGSARVGATLEQGAIATNLTASSIALSPYLPDVPAYLALTNADASAVVGFNALLDAATTGDFTQLNPRADADIRLAVNDGSADINFNAASGRWQVLADAGLTVTDNLIEALAGEDVVTSPRLPTPLTTEVRLAGDLDPVLRLGEVPIPVAVNRLNVNLGQEYLNTRGELLLSDLLTAPDLAADLAVDANYNSQRLPLVLLIADVTVGQALERPTGVSVLGNVAFNGQFRGRNLISDPIGDGNLDLFGDLQVENFAVNEVQFDPLLLGDVAVRTGEVIAIDLQGPEDRIAARLDPCRRGDACLAPYLPTSFEIRQDAPNDNQLLALGDRQGDVLDVRLQNFDLSLLNVVPGEPLGIEGGVDGDVTATLAANLFNLQSRGSVVVDNPALGYIRGEAIAANFGYTGDRVYLEDSYLQLGDNRFTLDAQTRLNLLGLVRGEQSLYDIADLPVDALLTVEQGSIGDLLSTVAWYEIEEIVQRGVASPSLDPEDLVLEPIGAPDRPIFEQIAILEKISEIVDENAGMLREPAPPRLADVRGTYDARVEVGGTLADPTVNARVVAQNWTWRPQPEFPAISPLLGFFLEDNRRLTIDEVVLLANYENEVLRVEQASLALEDASASLVGELSPTAIAGNFELSNLDVATLENFAALPLDIGGQINASAEFGGSLQQPTLAGTVGFESPIINGRPVDRFVGNFNYENDLFQFATVEPDWTVIQAQVPLPFTEANRMARARVALATPAFELVEALSGGQVVWLGGDGTIQLDATVDLLAATSGDFEAATNALQAEGIIAFEEATIEAVALPDARTQIDGRVLLNQDRVNVEGLVAQVAEGTFAIEGILPFLTPDPTLENPLTLKVDNGNINFAGLYEGLVDGSVTLTGTALTPVISGGILLSEGRASVPTGGVVESAVPVSAFWTVEPQQQQAEPAVIPVLDAFRVAIGENFRISNALPSFNFKVEGEVTVSGTLDGNLENLRPEGKISVEDGQINLFSSLFFIKPGRPQTVTFLPSQGLTNPNLDLQVSTLIYEERRNPLVDRDRNSNEIPDTTIIPTRQSRQILVNIGIDATANELVEALLENPSFNAASGDTSELLQTVSLSSVPSRSERELVSLLGGQVLTTVEEIANLRGTEVFGFAFMRFVVEPTLTEVLLDVDRVTNNVGETIGLDRLSVFPPGQVEAIYELNEDSLLGLTYDYGLNGFLLQGGGLNPETSGFNSIELRYELRF